MLRPIFLYLTTAGISLAEPVTLPLGQRSVLVDDSPQTTVITGKLDGERSVTLRIDWLNQKPEPTRFARTLDPTGKIAESTHRLGSSHLTRTILASEKNGAVFIHFLADMPGNVSFRATLQPPADGETITENRREIAWSSPTDSAKARVWIIPFESNVEPDGKSVLLRGEGECLLVFDFTPVESPEKPISKTWERICATYDPDETPPDPTKIWRAIHAAATAP